MIEKNVVYSGSFDPVTNGHLDMIRRAKKIFGNVTVLVLENVHKKTLFSLEERISLLKEALSGEEGIEVTSFSGLLADYFKKEKAYVIVRGIRGTGDLEHELINAHYNGIFAPEVETVFLPAKEKYRFVSSSAVREIWHHGGNFSDWVPSCVYKALQNKKSENFSDGI